MNRTIKELVPGLVYDDLRSVTDRELSWEKLDGKQILITGANGFNAIRSVLPHENSVRFRHRSQPPGRQMDTLPLECVRLSLGA